MTTPSPDPSLAFPLDEGRAYWDKNAPRYNLSMRLLGGALPRMVQLVLRELHPSASVLEVAAGTGLVTIPAAKTVKELIATDYSAGMIEVLEKAVRAEGLSNVQCLERDLYSLGFAPGSFDVVIAANVLHLLPDLPSALAALRAVLRPGGKLLAPTYCHDETFGSRIVSRLLALTGFPGRRKFTSLRLMAVLGEAGFSVQHHETIPGLIPVCFVSTRKPRRRG